MKLPLTVLAVAACAWAAEPEAGPRLPAQGVKPPENIAELFRQRFGGDKPGRPRAPREEVPYTLVEKTDKFELRTYPAWNWVCIEVVTDGERRDHTAEFLQIVMYLQGGNGAADHMPLTIPVMMQRAAAGSASMCAPIPASHQATVPAPLSPRLRLVAVPQTDVYVRRFGGRTPHHGVWLEQADALKTQLADAGRPYRDAIITAMFSGPEKRDNRRNEVWLLKA